MSDSLLAAALEYAARGWRVIPLHHLVERPGADFGCSCELASCTGSSRGKHPRFGKWAELASSDPERVKEWWYDYPRANIGVAFGPASGIVGVDIDSEAGEAKLLELSGGEVYETAEVRTGNGRRLLFSIPAAPPAAPRTVALKDDLGREAVRFQSTGGQGVMPPSRHYSGRYYEWVRDIEPVLMPWWMVNLLCHPDKPAFADAGAAAAFGAPGADFNLKADWAELLERMGATFAGLRDGVAHWTRPGKTGGTSATVGHYKAKDGTPALYVFSGSWPDLAAEKCYDKFGAYCVVPETKVLTADLRWVQAGSVSVGDELVGVDEKSPGGGFRRRLRPSVVEHSERRTLECAELLLSDGRRITATLDHPWLIKSPCAKNHRWVRHGELRPGMLMTAITNGTWDADDTREGGWLAGLFDGEGWVSGGVVGLAQNPGPVYDRATAVLKRRGFGFKERARKGTCLNATLSALPDILRFLGHIRPDRLLSKREWVGRACSSQGCDEVSVVSVTAVGPREVAAFQTSTRTFVAEGLVTHNTKCFHGGDFSAAARQLRADGFGAPRGRPPVRPTVHQPDGVQPAEPAAIDWPAPQPLTDDPPPPRAFPVELFPAALADFCREIAAGCVCPVDYPALFMLGVSSGLMGHTRVVRLTDTWVERGLLYCAVVAGKSGAKTPSFQAVMAPVKKEQARRNHRGEDAHLFLTDLTVASLPTRLQKQPRGLMAAVDELSGWAASFDQFKGKGEGSDRQHWLEMWAGSPLAVARKDKDAPYHFVSSPYVAVVGGIQPAVMHAMTSRDDGLIERFLFVSPPQPKPMGKKRVKYHHQPAWESCANLLMGLKQVEAEYGSKPLELVMPDETWDIFERWSSELAEARTDPSRNPALDGYKLKLEGYAARLAVVLDAMHYCCSPPGSNHGPNMPASMIEAGIELARFFHEQAEVVYRVRDPERSELAARLLALLRKPLGDTAPAGITLDAAGRVAAFTRSAMWLRLRRSVKTQDELAGPLKLLRDLGVIVIRAEADEGFGRPRKDSAVYLVNPRIHDAHPVHESTV